VAHILRRGIEETLSCTIAKRCLSTLEDLDDLELTTFYYLSTPDEWSKLDSHLFNNDIFETMKKFLLTHETYTDPWQQQELDEILEHCFSQLFRLDLIVKSDEDNQWEGKLPEYTLTRYGLIFARYLHDIEKKW
jgi:hypothetical protein